MTTFSVIVPTFNRARLIRETLDSLMGQTSPFDQVIVVDDGSTDDTSQVMASHYPSCQYIVQAHGHVQRARNTGIAAVKTDWVVFCDSDDLLVPDYLAQVRDVVASNPQLDVVYSNHSTFGQRRFVLEDRFAAEPEFWLGLEDIGVAFLGGGPGLAANLVGTKALLWPTGLAVKRSFLDIIGEFDERMVGLPNEDLEFTLRALAAGNGAFLKSPLARIRQGQPSVSNVDTIVYLQATIRLLQFALDHHPYARTDPLRHSLIVNLARHRRHCLYESFRNRDWPMVRQVATDLRGEPMSAKEWLKIACALLPETFSNGLHRVLRPMIS